MLIILSQPQLLYGCSFSVRRVAGLLALLLGVTLAGCSGCRSTAETPDEIAKQAGKDPLSKPLILQRATSLPAAAATPALLAKPGHWSTLRVEARANPTDFRGQLHVELATAEGRPLALDQQSYAVSPQREVVLPKQQLRPIEQLLFVPGLAEQANLNLALRSSSWAHGGAQLNSTLTLLAAPQYLAVVLSSEPDGYAFLAQHDWVRFTHDEIESTASAHYRVINLGKGPTALPRSALMWTAIAVVIWDRRDPNDLSPDEQQALIDWLHWGGQLVISGPESLELLRGSFLEPYLAATADETRTLDESHMGLFNEPPWQHSEADLKLSKPWSGVQLQPTADAHTLIGGADVPLIVERHVGAGRTVVSAFRLNQNEFINWPGSEPFWNACLLRRDPRTFKSSIDDSLLVQWLKHDRHDPALITDVRWFSRDVGKSSIRSAEAPPVVSFPAAQYDVLDQAAHGSGYGGWDDFSRVSNAARQILVEAAGIVVPERRFVLQILGLYIVLLVPVNWFLFRLIRRVEWAWAMVVVLALIFTGAVTYLAQLNVGFARSRTTVAVVEVPALHSRAHVTRYTALYSSLGTRYDVRVQHPSGLLLPMALGPQDKPDTPTTVTLERMLNTADDATGEGCSYVRLNGYEVGSNSTGLIHSEQIYDLGGPIELRERNHLWQITNRTRHTITGLIVAQQGAQRHVAWCSRLERGGSVELASGADSAERDEWLARFGELRGLAEVALDHNRDGVRLIGWIDDEMPGLEIRPAASQIRQQTFLLAHLREADWRPLAFDVNRRPMRKNQPTLTIGPDTKP